MSALSAIARQEYYVELGNSLPPPIRDNPEHLEHRFATAIETFEALRPGDAYEARLAVQIVLTGAHAAESLREAGLYRDDFAKRTRCRAQAASMMREEHAAKRMLAQEQKLRLATQAVANAANPQPAAAAAAAPPPRCACRRCYRPHRCHRPRRCRRRPRRCRRPPNRCARWPPRPHRRASARAGRVRTAALTRGDRQGRGLRAGACLGRGTDPPRPRRHATAQGTLPPPGAAHRSDGDRRVGPRLQRCPGPARRDRGRDDGCGRLTGPARKQSPPSHESGF